MKSVPSDHPETGFQSGLRDVLLEVIAPALLMVMLGSMVFFLLEILYRGQYELPIHWVYGLYVFAIVLVCRIAIIEGLERARFFAGLLIAAVAFHTGIGPHLIVVLLTWWAANKLTWDCTFIDASRDVSGQGLVSAAFDRWQLFQSRFFQVWRGEKSLAQIMADSDSATPPAAAEEPASPVARWMKDLLWKRKRKNTPGIWAFFFFIAGLIIFAVGQLFIEPSDRARNYSLWMFAAYVFSGLGLMMFVSLVGLFRYLKQRRTSMPDSIARSWLTLGTLIAAALAAAMLLIPWPSTNVSLSSWIPQFQTAKRTGDRSLLTERGKVDAPDGSGKPDERGASGKGSEPTEREGRGGVAGGDRVGDQPQGKPGSSSGGNVGGGRGPKPASSQAKSSQANAPPEKSNSGKPTPANQGPKQSTASAEQTKAEQTGPKQGESKSTQQRSSSGNPQKPENSATQFAPSTSRAPPPPSAQSPTTKADDRSSSEKRQQSRPLNQRTSAERAPSAERGSPEPKQEPRTAEAKSDATGWMQSLWAFVKSFGAILIWIAVIIAACIVGVRFRNQIIDGISAFFRSLSEFFARWLTGKRPTEGAGAKPSTAGKPPTIHRPFSSFRNPFSDSQWTRKPPIDVLAFTFAAFQALARDANIPRMEDETPLEFAQRILVRHRSLTGVRNLAELYSRAAYATDTITASDAQSLREVWEQMQSFARGLPAQEPAGSV